MSNSITKVTEDEPNYTTYLTAQTAPFSDVASTYDLDFGHITPYQQTSRIKERGLLGAVSCVVTGSCDESRSVTFDVSAGTKGKVSNIYSDKRLTLDCINCFTTGSFKLAGHISVYTNSIRVITKRLITRVDPPLVNRGAHPDGNPTRLHG